MPGDPDVLESWKEIAAYLKRDVTTVQRWEKREGLPVHRHLHDKSGSVFARKSELAEWHRARTRVAEVLVDAPDATGEATAHAHNGNGHARDAVPRMPPEPPPMSAGSRAALFAAGLTVLLLTVGALAPTPTKSRPPQFVFTVAPPAGVTLMPSDAPMISPDGKSLVYVGIGDDGITRLRLRPMDDLVSRVMPGTEGARYPFWSADSRQIAFFAEGKLKTLSLGNGEPRTVCDAPNGQPGAWSDNDIILFPTSGRSGLFRVRAEGGAPVLVTRPDIPRGDFAHRVPHFLPGGEQFVFLVRSTRPDRQGIYLGTLRGGEPRMVMRSTGEAWYAAGYLLFVQPPALMAQPLHPETLLPRGAPFALTREASEEAFSARGLFSVSATGTVAYAAVSTTTTMRVVRIDRHTGRRSETGIPSGEIWDLSPTPDQALLSMTRIEGRGGRDVWTVDLRTRNLVRLTTDPADDAMPVWSPTGDRLAFSSRRLGDFDIFVRGAASDQPIAQVVTGAGDQWVNDWSSDGRWLLYSATVEGNTTRSDLLAFHLETRRAIEVVTTVGRDTQGRFSPDGRWIAYACDADGRPEVYVARFPPDGASPLRVSSNGGGYPRWRRDGQEIFYVDAAGSLMAATIEYDSAPVVRSRHVVTRGAFLPLGPAASGVGADYVPAPDGGSFLLKEPVEAVAGPVTLVVNGLHN